MQCSRSANDRRLFLLQRLSALLMAPLVLLHLGVVVYAVRGGLSAAEILGRTQGSYAWGGFYAVFVLLAAIHGAIGVRVVALEWARLRPRSADWLAALLVAGLALLGWRAVYAVVAT